MIDTDAIIASSANMVKRRFYSFVDRDDLVAEGQLWILLHPIRRRHYEDDEQQKRAEYRLRRDVAMAMELYARCEKAAMLGYDPDDEYFYSATLVGALLPAIFGDGCEPPRRESDGSVSRRDPAEGGSWQAQRLDVATAWDTADLSTQEREYLVDYYVFGFSQQAIAEQQGVDQTTVGRRISLGIRKVVAELGGEKPRGCPYDCECHEGLLSIRPGVKSRRSGINQSFD